MARRVGTTRTIPCGEMKTSETAVADQRKAREKFLQSLDKEMVDPDTGEIISPAVQQPG